MVVNNLGHFDKSPHPRLPDSGGLQRVTGSSFIWPSFNFALNSARLPCRREFPIKCFLFSFFLSCLKDFKLVSTFGASKWGYVKLSAVEVPSGGRRADQPNPSPIPEPRKQLRSVGWKQEAPADLQLSYTGSASIYFPHRQINWLLMAAVIGFERAESDYSEERQSLSAAAERKHFPLCGAVLCQVFYQVCVCDENDFHLRTESLSVLTWPSSVSVTFKDCFIIRRHQDDWQWPCAYLGRCVIFCAKRKAAHTSFFQ